MKAEIFGVSERKMKVEVNCGTVCSIYPILCRMAFSTSSTAFSASTMAKNSFPCSACSLLRASRFSRIIRRCSAIVVIRPAPII